MKRWVYTLIPVVVLFSLIGWRIQQKKAEMGMQASQQKMRMGGAPPVTLASAEVRDISQSFEATGSVEAPLHVAIAPKVAGRIEYLQVQEGDRIHKGQVLVRIDPSEVEAEVRAQQANVAEARYRLAQAKLTENSTNVGVSTQIRQQRAGSASARADYNQVKKNYEAQLASANASVSDAASRVNSA